MNEASTPESTPPKIKQPEHVAAGVYTTAAVVSNTREEFFMDFLATYTAPLRLMSRIILSPGHAKRLVKALQNNLKIHREHFPAASPATEQKPQNPVPMQDIYSQLNMPDAVQGGTYANNVLIRHTREEFILDFLVVFHPAPVLVARILISPGHVQRIANVLEERIKSYEKSFGPLEDPPSAEPPAPLPRFSLS